MNNLAINNEKQLEVLDEFLEQNEKEFFEKLYEDDEQKIKVINLDNIDFNSEEYEMYEKISIEIMVGKEIFKYISLKLEKNEMDSISFEDFKSHSEINFNDEYIFGSIKKLLQNKKYDETDCQKSFLFFYNKDTLIKEYLELKKHIKEDEKIFKTIIEKIISYIDNKNPNEIKKENVVSNYDNEEYFNNIPENDPINEDTYEPNMQNEEPSFDKDMISQIEAENKRLLEEKTSLQEQLEAIEELKEEEEDCNELSNILETYNIEDIDKLKKKIDKTNTLEEELKEFDEIKNNYNELQNENIKKEEIFKLYEVSSYDELVDYIDKVEKKSISNDEFETIKKEKLDLEQKVSDLKEKEQNLLNANDEAQKEVKNLQAKVEELEDKLQQNSYKKAEDIKEEIIEKNNKQKNSEDFSEVIKKNSVLTDKLTKYGTYILVPVMLLGAVYFMIFSGDEEEFVSPPPTKQQKIKPVMPEEPQNISKPDKVLPKNVEKSDNKTKLASLDTHLEYSDLLKQKFKLYDDYTVIKVNEQDVHKGDVVFGKYLFINSLPESKMIMFVDKDNKDKFYNVKVD